MSSVVVITLEFAWKALWVVMSFTNSVPMSTVDCSSAFAAIDPRPFVLGGPVIAVPDAVVSLQRFPPSFERSEGL